MERLVVDSSVAIKWFVREPHSDETRRILDDYRTGKLDLLAPDLLYAEFGNIVWKKQRLQGLAASDAATMIQVLETLPLIVTTSASLLSEAYQLAVAHQRTVYDMMIVEIAIVRNHACFGCGLAWSASAPFPRP